MRCLFCKLTSDGSISKEHIIPESLGNRSHVLPPGVVCDSCNNYFSHKVEKPFLESCAILALRFNQALPSKRGRVPVLQGIITPGVPAIVRRDLVPGYFATVEVDPVIMEHLRRIKSGTLIFPGAGEPDPHIVSRFMAKIAVEAMAHRLVAYPDGLEYLANEPQLDLIRNHARFDQTRNWPVHLRRIYDANKMWPSASGEPHQVVHEFDILETTWGEWFLVLAIFGLELVINIGGPEIDGYSRWLSENGNASPLYWGKNASK